MTRILLYVITALLIPYEYWQDRKQRKWEERVSAVRSFRDYVMRLELDRCIRSGTQPRYFDRLPHFADMVDDRLPLTLESYYHDSEIRALRGEHCQPTKS